jgi:hypothetical protein
MTHKGFEILAEITAIKFQVFWLTGIWVVVAGCSNGVGTLSVVLEMAA